MLRANPAFARSLKRSGLRRAKVEPQGIEPWSREDERVRSTCLVDFDCREEQGRQQPNFSVAAVFSTAHRDTVLPSFTYRHRDFSSCKTKALSDDGLPPLRRNKLIQP